MLRKSSAHCGQPSTARTRACQPQLHQNQHSFLYPVSYVVHSENVSSNVENKRMIIQQVKDFFGAVKEQVMPQGKQKSGQQAQQNRQQDNEELQPPKYQRASTEQNQSAYQGPRGPIDKHSNVHGAQGFAAMSEEKLREIGSMGGSAPHAKPRGFAAMPHERVQEIGHMGGVAPHRPPRPYGEGAEPHRGGERERESEYGQRGEGQQGRGFAMPHERVEEIGHMGGEAPHSKPRGFAAMPHEKVQEIAHMGGSAPHHGPRGFAAMPREQVQEIAHKGGRASQTAQGGVGYTQEGHVTYFHNGEQVAQDASGTHGHARPDEYIVEPKPLLEDEMKAKKPHLGGGRHPSIDRDLHGTEYVGVQSVEDMMGPEGVHSTLPPRAQKHEQKHIEEFEKEHHQHSHPLHKQWQGQQQTKSS